MKQNSNNIRGSLIGLPQIAVHTREFNLSHMPNPLDTNKIKVVRVNVVSQGKQSVSEKARPWRKASPL